MERTLRKVGKQPVDPVRWRALQTQLDRVERELRRAEIAERRKPTQSRWTRRQVSQPEGFAERRRREAAAREERRDSMRRQQVIRDAARTIRTLRGALNDLALGPRRPRRWGL
jgi:hypothetical protein